MNPSRPMLAAIWAQTRDGVIGNAGAIPWHVPEDFAHFKATTLGHPVIMGRRTWESFPPQYRPLPQRKNIVITSRPEAIRPDDNVVVTDSYEHAVDAAQAPQIWVIGGSQVYANALAHPYLPVMRCVISVLDLKVNGDAHAPQLDDRWHLTSEQDRGVSRHGVPWRVQIWDRSV